MTSVNPFGLAVFEDAPDFWSEKQFCAGGIACTSQKNILMSFTNTVFSGSTPIGSPEFHIISNLDNVSNLIDDCQYQSRWNAYSCGQTAMGQLSILAEDRDSRARSAAPVTVSNSETGYENVLNSFMDHDGGRASYKSQFTALLQPEGHYTVEFSGANFNKMRYRLDANEGRIHVTVKNMSSPWSNVILNGTVVSAAEWDPTEKAQARLSSYAGCGSNRYNNQDNSLEFILTAGCELQVRTESAIKSRVRLDMTEEQFYQQNGTRGFIERVAAALQINSSRLQVVEVRLGSVIVDYVISPDPTSYDADAELRSVELSQSQLFKVGGSAILGAQVLDSDSSLIIVVDKLVTDVAPTVEAVTQVIKDRKKLSAGALAGIIIGSIFGAGCLCCCLLACCGCCCLTRYGR